MCICGIKYFWQLFFFCSQNSKRDKNWPGKKGSLLIPEICKHHENNLNSFLNSTNHTWHSLDSRQFIQCHEAKGEVSRKYHFQFKATNKSPCTIRANHFLWNQRGLRSSITLHKHTQINMGRHQKKPEQNWKIKFR